MSSVAHAGEVTHNHRMNAESGYLTSWDLTGDGCVRQRREAIAGSVAARG
jgi:hypothetical protein